MLTLLFFIILIGTLGNLLDVAFRMSWGLLKIVFTVVFWPIILVVMVLCGLLEIALPILAIIGLISLFTTRSRIDPL